MALEILSEAPAYRSPEWFAMHDATYEQVFGDILDAEEQLAAPRTVIAMDLQALYDKRMEEVEAHKRRPSYAGWDDGADDLRAAFLLVPGDRKSGEAVAMSPSGKVIVFEAEAMPYPTGETLLVPKDTGLIAREGLVAPAKTKYDGAAPTRRGAMFVPYSNGEPAPMRTY